jgi:hypothetical protein
MHPAIVSALIAIRNEKLMSGLGVSDRTSPPPAHPH